MSNCKKKKKKKGDFWRVFLKQYILIVKHIEHVLVSCVSHFDTPIFNFKKWPFSLYYSLPPVKTILFRSRLLLLFI